MAVETRTVGRTREITGHIYLERWIQIDAGTAQIYGTSTSTGDLNVLDTLADSLTAASGGRMFYGGASPGEYDAGETNRAWYGQVIRVAFRRLQASAQWHTLKTEIETSFIAAAFPGELILEANRRLEERPLPGDLSDPAKFIIWTIEYD